MKTTDEQRAVMRRTAEAAGKALRRGELVGVPLGWDNSLALLDDVDELRALLREVAFACRGMREPTEGALSVLGNVLTERDELRERVRVAEKERDEAREQRDYAYKVNEEHRLRHGRETDEYQRENDAHRKRIAELEASRSECIDAMTRAQDERDAAQQRAKALESEIDVIRRENRMLNDSNAALAMPTKDADGGRAEELEQALREAGHALTLGTPELVQESIQKIWALVGTEAP